MSRPISKHDPTVRRFLARALYCNQELCRRDILAALHHYEGLQPKLEKYGGWDKICLDGTIPVAYQGNRFNIPVAIWIRDTHPTHAPLCYVRPTPDMRKYHNIIV